MINVKQGVVMRKYVVMLLALFVACSGQEKKEDKTEQAQIKPKAAVEKIIEYTEFETLSSAKTL